jgi:hypothetical protein
VGSPSPLLRKDILRVMQQRLPRGKLLMHGWRGPQVKNQQFVSCELRSRTMSDLQFFGSESRRNAKPAVEDFAHNRCVMPIY